MPRVIGTKDGSFQGGETAEPKKGIWIRKRKFSLTYCVIGDTTEDDEQTILATTGIPALLSPVRGAYCKSRQARCVTRIKHPVTGVDADYWEVECQFDTEASEADQQGAGNPTARRPKVKWSGVEEEVVLEKDVNGNPIQTQPGEKIIFKDTQTFPILEITRIELYPFDPLVILDYSNKANSDFFYGAPPGTAKFFPPESEEIEIEDETFVQVTYKIKFDLQFENQQMKWFTWVTKEILHQGFMYRPQAGAAPIIKVDVGGNPMKINLAANGTELAPNQPEEFLSFDIRLMVDFNNLNLGPF